MSVRAKEWLGRQRDGRPDYWQARIQSRDARKEILDRAIFAIKILMECDKQQPYWVRHAWAYGLGLAVKEPADLDEILANANFPEGGERISASGRVKEVIEEQFVFHSTLMELQEILFGVQNQLKKFSVKVDNPWNWIGNLQVDPPMSRKSKSSISVNGDATLGVAVLGLSCALSQIFRLVSSNLPHMGRWVGEEMTKEGRACWAAISEYVNSAFLLDGAVEEEALRQRWHQFSRGRVIRLHHWPRDAVCEPQLRDNILPTD